ncbi:hypothetical protein NHX12_006233 [Muraenolepis orangiensis]|uniref:Cadherin domain-containing protein n=1 Tax=Muraenolepis orangiensis TaxID=630683 RepID=A0A9Q0DVE7_9TELE|nr:hypothetical protein NHX12_006233 [Muraenolepis orangiensis]
MTIRVVQSTGHPYLPDACGGGANWYLVRVEMTVTDVNDNVPEWSMAPVPYLAVVSPEAVPGSLVYQLLARDDDGGDNGEVEFFFSDGKQEFVPPKLQMVQKSINPSSLFSISGETGEISLMRSMDYEGDQHRYLLLVRANEGLGSLSSAAESIYSKDGVQETVTTATSILQG